MRIDDEIVAAASVVQGGRLGDDARLGELCLPKTPTAELPELVAAQIIETLGPDTIRLRDAVSDSTVSDPTPAVAG